MKRQTTLYWYSFLLFLAVTGFSQLAFGQTNCSQVMVDAQNQYEDGKINEIPALLESCMESGFTREEKIEAYKLLAMVYTFLDEDENADQSVLNLLKLDKEYTINPELDPAEFIEVFNTFRTYPVFRVGIKIGSNNNTFRISETYGTHNGSNAGTYTSLNGLHFGLAVEIPIKDKYEVVPEAYYMTRSYHYEVETGGPLGKTSFIEQQVWLMVPVYFRYKYLKWRVVPYGDIGFSFGYLLSSELNSVETSRGIETPTTDWAGSREPLNFFASAGLGAKLKIPMGYLFIESRYGFQINRTNVLNVETADAEDAVNTLLWNNFHRDNSFSMDYITIQVGYAFNIYSPKKLEP